MDEDNLPILHIRRAKKRRPPEKDDGLPDLTIQQKGRPSRKETIGKQSFSPANTPTYQERERYQPEQGQSRLGRDIKTGKYVDVPQASRRQGLYVIGATGTGKSGLIENLIVQDIKQGYGVCVLDPHGDLINAVLSRMDRREDDVILLDITDYHYPFGINMFACSDPTNPLKVSEIVEQVRHIFEKVLGVSQETQLILEYLYNCTYTLIANPGYTMADIPLLLQDGECRRKLVVNVTDSDVRLFWRLHEQKKPADQNTDIASILRRVRQLLQPLSRPIVGQSSSTIDLQRIMDEGKILLVKLSAQYQSISNLIGSILIALILNAAYARPANKRRQFNLYADEFQRFATEDFATLLTEARKFGIATTIAHQARYQPGMTDGIRATTLGAANLVVFRVQPEDATELAGRFDITPQEAWEQEIEPERIKVLRPQEHERIEEQVEVEVEEDILEIPHNPLEYLDKGRFIPISKRTQEARYKMKELYELSIRGKPFYYEDFIDKLLVSVMEKKITVGSQEFNQQIDEFIKNYIIPKPGMHYDQYYGEENLPRLERLIWDAMHEVVSHPEKEQQLFQEFYDAVDSLPIVPAKRVYKKPYPIISNHELHYDETEYHVPQSEEQREFYFEERIKIVANYKYWFHILPNLVILCEGLAEEPVRVSTGQKRMVKRVQPHITYLTHESEKITIPRKTIMHPQRTYADMLNEVASQIANLPVYTAKVKITVDEQEVERTIRTLDPKQEPGKPLFGQALQDRIARIQAHNRTPSMPGALPYCRSRQEVEAEIRTRQEQCSQPPPEEPPISRRPPR